MKGRKIKSLPYIKFSEDKDDPYRIDKIPDGAYCEQCGIVYIDKNWKLKAIEREKKVPIICPACRKINDKYYMGVLTISGEFLKEHKDEIINLIKNEEKKLRSKNSLPRIALIEELNGAIVVNTTSVRMAYRIGKALNNAYKGDFSIKWSDNNVFTRVYWSRDI